MSSATFEEQFEDLKNKKTVHKAVDINPNLHYDATESISDRIELENDDILLVNKIPHHKHKFDVINIKK